MCHTPVTLIKTTYYYPSTESITWVLPNYSVPATQKTSECASLFLTYLACIKERSTMIRVSGIWFFSETRLCGEGADLPICWRLGIHLWSFHTQWPQLSYHFWTTWWQIDQGGQLIQSIAKATLWLLFFRLQSPLLSFMSMFKHNIYSFGADSTSSECCRRSIGSLLYQLLMQLDIDACDFTFDTFILI